MNAKLVSTPPQEIKKRMTLIQLTRVGDLVQTFQMARLLKEEHPEIELTLVARKQYANPLKFLLENVFDDIILLDTDKIFRSHESITLDKCKSELRKFLLRVNQHPASVSINLSFCKTSSYLHSLIHSEFKVGPYYDLTAQKVIKDKWSQYLYSTVMRGDLNPYNLVDLFKNIVGVKSIKSVEVKHQKRRHIVLHPFASQERKRWKNSKWSEVVYKLLKDNRDLKITIVGAKSDLIDCDDILNTPLLASFLSQIENKVGKTNIEEVYNLLDDKTLFVGHDSAISHLAATRGTQSLTIALGNARAQETAPYADGNYVLAPKTKCYPCFPDVSCSYYQCHADIPYQVVICAITNLLDGKELEEKTLLEGTSHFQLNGVELFKTKTNANGHQRVERVIKHSLNSKEAMRDIYTIAWQFLFNETEEDTSFPELSANAYAELKNDISGIKHCYELCEFGKKYSRYILEEISSKTPDLAQIKSYSAKIDEIDGLFEIVKNTFSRLHPVLDFLTISKSNLHGSNIVELSESSFLTYNDSSMLLSLIFELINKTVAEYEKTNIKTSTKELR